MYETSTTSTDGQQTSANSSPSPGQCLRGFDPYLLRAQARRRAYELRSSEASTEDSAFVAAATRDAYTWVTQHTETWNEHWVEEGRPSPYEKFPQCDYFRDLFNVFETERV